jgi:hypothetical protein
LKDFEDTLQVRYEMLFDHALGYDFDDLLIVSQFFSLFIGALLLIWVFLELVA